MTRRVSHLWCLAVLLAAAGTAPAAVVYSNLGPGDTYSGSSGLTLDNTHRPAQSFIPTASVNLDSIEVAVLRNPFFSGNTGNFIATLAADNAGTPGTTLASLGAGLTNADFGSGINTDHLVSLTPVGAPPALAAGTRYWLILSPGSATTAAVWMFSNLAPPDTSPADSSFNNGPFTPTGTVAVALRVTGSVPEPASLSLVGLLATTCLCRRRA